MNSPLEVTVLNRQRDRSVSAPALAGFVRRLAREAPPERADRLGVCLVSDRAMSALNLRYRRKPGTTDVLSFPWRGASGHGEGRHLGDIVISVPRARAQAREARHGLARELRLLLLHGYLHLLGYDHETDGGTMRRLERRLAKRLCPQAKAAS